MSQQKKSGSFFKFPFGGGSSTAQSKPDNKSTKSKADDSDMMFQESLIMPPRSF